MSPAKRTPKARRPYMPGYGIPKTKQGLLPWTWAERRLKQSHNYWISTTRPDGAPHTMVVWGLWLDRNFYFSTGAESRKGRNLAKNPRCVIATEKAAEAVVVEGTATVVSNRPLLKRFATLYMKKYKWDMSSFSEPVYAVQPHAAFGLYEKKFMGSATRWEF
jgi:nitroimidazol reductase NimA-like FMN-containing flavoprotein (pyridoxamine 5'-phosphate oxidase superfamily)